MGGGGHFGCLDNTTKIKRGGIVLYAQSLVIDHTAPAPSARKILRRWDHRATGVKMMCIISGILLSQGLLSLEIKGKGASVGSCCSPSFFQVVEFSSVIGSKSVVRFYRGRSLTHTPNGSHDMATTVKDVPGC